MSGPKSTQPSASASSPTTEIEAAYKQVYDDLDKRKTQKGWAQRKMGWVRGHKVLKELLVSYVSYNLFQDKLPPRLGGIEVTIIDFRAAGSHLPRIQSFGVVGVEPG